MNTRTMIVAGVAVLLIMLVGGYLALAQRDIDTPDEAATSTGATAPTSPEAAAPKEGAKTGGTLKVSPAKDGGKATIPPTGKVSIKGTTTCLPPRDANGPQNASCALGLKGEDGNYYALQDTDPTYRNVSSVPSNSEVTVQGTFAPGTNPAFPTVGIIAVTNIVR